MLPILEHIQKNKQDAIFWQATTLISEAGDDVMKKVKATDDIAQLISLLNNETARSLYIDALSKNKALKLSKKDLQAACNNAVEKKISDEPGEDDEYANMPAWMDREEVLDKGFCTLMDKENNRVGYFGWGANGKSRISNFIIHPIFHVEGNENSRHIFEIENHRKRVVLDVPSKVFVSLETLQQHLVGQGNFIFYGSKPQLLNVSTTLLDHFPMCKEIKSLGWQQEGFFAFVNKVFVPGQGLLDISRWGIVDVNDRNFLIPASSEVYKNMRQGEDPFEQDRVIELVEPHVSMKDWAKQMHIVYQEHGLVGVAYTLANCFYDIVFSIDHNFPHCYGYGERSSGKSKWAESISSVFFRNRSPFQLNSGTDFAFFNFVGSFRNCPAVLNEFDDKIVRDEWFQSIKGFFDGEGRGRGSMGKIGRAEVQRAAGGIILLGQFLSTKDDNSNVTRSCVNAFSERDFTEEDKREYLKLKEWESKGLTHLLPQILEHRDSVKTTYYEKFNEILGQWRRHTTDQFNQRIFQNWCHLATMWCLFYEKLHLPVSFVEFEGYAYNNAVKWSQFVRETDIVSEFWNTVAFLNDQQEILEGWDFKIVTQAEVRLRSGDGKEYEKKFDAPKKLLYFRLNNVHKLYQASYNSRTRKEAMTLDNLMHYFTNRPYYVGKVKQTQFKRYVYKTVEKPVAGPLANSLPHTVSSERVPEQTITSAYVFDYDLLGCELERVDIANNGQSELF